MQRTKTLTTYTIKIYKSIVLILVACIMMFLLLRSTNRFTSFLFVVQYAYLFYFVLRGVLGIKYVEYDNANLYVNHNDYQVQVPFEEVKEVKLMSVDGVYKFILYKKGQLGKEILCKPSIWYPFNYNKVDNELHRIRGLIYKRKQEYYNQIGLGSGVQLNSLNLE